MIVAVHPKATEDRDWPECEQVLTFLGYKIHILGQQFAPEPKYIIDPRIPEWRGVKTSVEHLKLNHPHSKIQEWNRLKDQGLDKVCKVSYTDVDSDCPS